MTNDNVIATVTLPIFVLPTNTVLFPGITVRMPLASGEATSIVTRLNTLSKAVQQQSDSTSATGGTTKKNDNDSDNDNDKKAIQQSNEKEKQHISEIIALHKALELKETSFDGSRAPIITIGILPRTDPEQDTENSGSLTSDLTRSVSPSDPTTPHSLKSLVHSFGIIARISRIERTLTGKFHALVECYNRLHVEEFTEIGTITEARVSVFSDDSSSDRKFSIWPREELEKLEALKASALKLIEFMVSTASSGTGSGSGAGNNSMAVRPEILKKVVPLIRQTRTRRAAGILTDILAFIIPLEYNHKIQLLSATLLNQRIDMVTKFIREYIESEKISEKIDKTVEDNISKQQREFILRQKLNAIKEELGEKNGGNGSSSSLKGGFGSRGGGGGGASADGNEEDEDIGELKKKLDNLKLPEEGQKIVAREMKRLKRMHPTQAEYQVCRTYLETIAEIPWSTATSDKLYENPVARAKKILDDDHYGLNKVKRRLLEYLAVLHLKQQQHLQQKKLLSSTNDSSSTSTALVPYKPKNNKEEESDDGNPPLVHDISEETGLDVLTLDKSPILLLVGPPGVGKTSLAKSVAHALGRKFHRISLGGVRDEAEIRGHRRTYVGAMPGVLVQSLRKVGVINPVILLDEIDKVSKSNFHGDPSAALLEVLDPEQNHTFTDHYINFPVDLSKTLFIATANSLDGIPGPLLDRMETINIEGYTYMEKQKIAQNYLIPKQLKNNGLEKTQLTITDEAVLRIATGYTREAGVRNLGREIGTVCRGKAVEYARRVEAGTLNKYDPIVDVKDLKRYLGNDTIEDDIVDDEVDEYVDSRSGERRRRHTYGVVNGLAYMGSGNGGLLLFEAAAMPAGHGGHGSLKTTGRLGSVIAESAEIALSWVRSNAYQLGITQSRDEDVVKNIDIHLHAPAGAVPKDGPSAGVAMTVALVSLLAKRPVPRDIAMTGEMTLRGKVLPVGGIREKLLGAHAAGIRKVLLPYHSRKLIEEGVDWEDQDQDQETEEREQTPNNGNSSSSIIIKKKKMGRGDFAFVKETNLEIVYVKYIWDVLAEVWPEEGYSTTVIDSHL